MLKKYYVYILECVNNTYYTGYTTDLKRRYTEHCAGSPKCKYTRAFPPKRIAAHWCFGDKSRAMQVEAIIKTLSKSEKVMLIQTPELLPSLPTT